MEYNEFGRLFCGCVFFAIFRVFSAKILCSSEGLDKNRTGFWPQWFCAAQYSGAVVWTFDMLRHSSMPEHALRIRIPYSIDEEAFVDMSDRQVVGDR